MTARFLPPSEWHRLSKAPIGEAAEQMSPDQAEVLVIEDEQGEIVGTWADVLMLHLEGFWVDPAHREKAAVARALLRAMFDHLRENGVKVALTAAPGPKVESILLRLGAQPLDVKPFILPVPDEF